MGTFYGPSLNPDELYHYKYVRKYRKNGKWNYVYPGDHKQPQTSNQEFRVTVNGEKTKRQQKADEYVKSHSSKRVSDIEREIKRQNEQYKNLVKEALKGMR